MSCTCVKGYAATAWEGNPLIPKKPSPDEVAEQE
jgi:hypothetical protein